MCGYAKSRMSLCEGLMSESRSVVGDWWRDAPVFKLVARPFKLVVAVTENTRSRIEVPAFANDFVMGGPREG